MEQTITEKQVLVDLDKLYRQIAREKVEYQSNSPFPHIAIDDFLEVWAAKKALSEFPAVKDQGWIHYIHVNEKKHGLNKMDLLPPFIRKVIEELNTPAFLKYLSELTGIENLLPDDMLEGGGLHQSLKGGFLNIHADFTVHPHKRNWRRRVNLLVYLNEEWLPSYGGDLELWDRQMKGCERKISPIFNRCVIFNTDDDSYHGLPDPITCPEGMTRKSIALYYFTEEKVAPKMRSTNYQARPQDGYKALFIYLDKKLISLYTAIKGKLGINDDFVSNVLNKFSGKNNKK